MIGDAVANAAENAADRISLRVETAVLKAGMQLAAVLAIGGAIVFASVALAIWLNTFTSWIVSLLITSALYLLLAAVLVGLARFRYVKYAPDPVSPSEVAEDETRAVMRETGLLEFLLGAAGIGAVLGLMMSSDDDNRSSPGLLSLLMTAASTYNAFGSLANASTTSRDENPGENAGPLSDL
ncbi:MAG: hypothetical protein AAFY15_00690 [Cyanobacteria bacterium J06648_11]